MTQEEIIEMANEAELCQSIWIDSPDENLASVIRFAKLVEAKAEERERNACAKRAEIALLGTLKTTSERVLKAIRARGEA